MAPHQWALQAAILSYLLANSGTAAYVENDMMALCVCCRLREALTYLAHAYETNTTLLRNGEKRGMDKSVIAVYRRKCLTVSKAALCSQFGIIVRLLL